MRWRRGATRDLLGRVVLPPNPPSSSDSDSDRRLLIERTIAATSESRFTEAAVACRKLAQFAGDSEARAAWADAAEVLDRLAQTKPVAAFMHGYVSPLPDPLHDALIERLASELELANQPLLATAALDRLGPSRFVETERARLARELDPRLAEDHDERVRSVAQRVVEHFRDAVEARDVRALRASARALIELQRPKEALVRVRQALELDPNHLATRLSEADLLGEIGERDARRALLIELGAAYPSSVAPARRLAADFAENAEAEPGALAEASYWYAETIARHFDEAMVMEFAKLLERTGQIPEAIAQLEAGHARTRELLWQEDFARELARLQRDRGQLQQAERWSKEVERKVGIRERGYAIGAIALMVVLLGVLVAVMLLS
jgi:tetratricopeptide (TPR) repeat protein